MRKVPLAESLKIIGRGSMNWIAERPIVVSFEVTDACTCYCKHCDHGGPRDESRNLKPADYLRYMETLRPCVVQVSGGEPLMRPDILDIVRTIKSASCVPYTILVSNWSEMTPEKYVALREAGIDQFSVSLDFPDDRHDTFRGYPGLFQHLSTLMPQLAAMGHDDIVLNSCITSENVDEIGRIADMARAWKRQPLLQLLLRAAHRLQGPLPQHSGATGHAAPRARCRREAARRDELDRQLAHDARGDARLLRQRRAARLQGRTALPGGHRGRHAPALLDAVPALRARGARAHGERVHGQLTQCDQCYVSIRSYLDKSFPRLLWENVSGFLSFESKA